MSGSTESQEGFLSRRGFFRWASSLAAALGMAPLVSSAKGCFVADGIVRW